MKRYVFIVLLVFLYSVTLVPIGVSQTIQESIDKAREDIDRVIDDPQSIARDSILIYNYYFLSEQYRSRDEAVTREYISKIDAFRGGTDWPKVEGLYHRAVGRLYDHQGNFPNALDSYERAIEAFEAVGDQSQYISYVYIYKAFVLLNTGLYDECEAQLKIIEPIAEKLEKKDCLAYIIDAYGDLNYYPAFGRKDYEKALEYYLEVEKLLPYVTRKRFVADNANGLAGVYLRLGMDERAAHYRDIALTEAEKHGFRYVTFAVYSDLADVYDEVGNYEDAIRYRQMAREYVIEDGWILMESRAENNLAWTYKYAGDYENALAHFERYWAIEDSLSRYQVQERYAELQTKYELGKKDLEIESLKADKLRFYRNLLLAILLLGAIFVIYYVRMNDKLINQNAELLAKNDEIKAALTQGRNIERKRMAIELHDNINAKIAATKWMLESLESIENPEEQQGVIDKLVLQVTEIYEDVRFISHNLVPREIEENSLDTILTQLFDNLNQNQKIQFSFTSNGDNPGLSNALKLQTYSMLMELINNVMKHSDSERASIDIDYAPEFMKIRIADDGLGFDTEAEQSGIGLSNVRERLKNLNGSMDIRSNKRSGVEIKMEIPLDQAN